MLMSDLEEKEPTRRVHKVVIKGTVEGYDVATIDDLNKILREIKRQHVEMDNLKNQFNELQNTFNAMSARLERIENFLKSFR